MNAVHKILFAFACFVLFTTAQAGSVWARGDNAEIFLQDTNIGSQLKKYFVSDGRDSYKLVASTGPTSLYNEVAWKSTMGTGVDKYGTEILRGNTPYVIWTHRTLQHYRYLPFIKRITSSCSDVNDWTVSDPVIHTGLSEQKRYRPGKVVAYFPNPNLPFFQQNPNEVYIGVHIKYEKRDGNWGFWIADQGWHKDQIIRKHFISSNNLPGKYNAKNWRTIESPGCF